MPFSSLTTPFVSVIIPHYNDLQNLRRCIETLRAQTWSHHQIEIIVADNNSREEIAKELRSIRGIQAISAKEQGAGPARNAGVRASHGDILAFIDSDCLAGADWVREGVAALQHFDYVGGDVRIPVRDPTSVTPAEAYDVVFGFDFKKYIERDKFSGTGNLIVPRAVFDKVGEFRNGVSEDMDWCWRANALGFRLGYAPMAIVYHPPRHEWASLTAKWDRIISETLTLARERPGWKLRWLLRVVATAASSVPHAPKVLFSTKLPNMRSRFRGLLGLVAIRIYRARRMLIEMARTTLPTK
jgi:glycosyltransferase involved in cell wall biosynthesis